MSEAERFRSIDRLFREAARLPVADRAAFLSGACEGDERLRREVLALLEEDERSRGALDAPAINEPIRLSRLGVHDGSGISAPVPERIGRYRILSRIGSGGMGTVYEAEQDNPRRTVAVKVVSQGIVSPATLRRFEHEAQMLGRLEHPGIARIYEAGVQESPGGMSPYFAMELIRGETLIEHAQRRALPMRERLALLADICDAVHHAHQRGVIHRDIKPANILVDETGRPRVLDFGVARAVDDDAQLTARTDAGQVIGTLAYMSPEQAACHPSDVDTRTDVYALGVIGYELLSGALPLDLRGRSMPDALRQVCETEPTPLSVLNKSLRGDVQTIISRALEKDRARRYDSAAALGADIRRSLANEAIQARPATTLYQMRKFAARHRAFVVAACVVAGALLVTLGVSIVSLQRTRAALARAERQATIARTVQSFMNEDLIGAADGNRLGPAATVRQAVDYAAGRASERFEKEPLVAAAVHASIGNLYWSLGEYELGEKHLQTSLELFNEHGEKTDETRLYVLNDLARYYLELYKPEIAEPLLNEALPLCTQTFGPTADETFTTETSLARVLIMKNEIETAEAHLRDVVARAEAAHGPDSKSAFGARSQLGGLLLNTDQPAMAEPVIARTLDYARRVYGPEHAVTLTELNNLAVTYEKLDRLPEAADMHKQGLAILERLFGRHHPQTLPVIYNLASVYFRQKDYSAAEPLMLEVLEQCRKTFGSDHIGTMRTVGKLADLYVAKGDLARAEPLMREAVEIAERLLGPDHPETIEFKNAADSLHMSGTRP